MQVMHDSAFCGQARNVPVCLRGAATAACQGWPAAETWSDEGLKACCGHRPVKARCQPQTDGTFGDPVETRVQAHKLYNFSTVPSLRFCDRLTAMPILLCRDERFGKLQSSDGVVWLQQLSFAEFVDTWSEKEQPAGSQPLYAARVDLAVRFSSCLQLFVAQLAGLMHTQSVKRPCLRTGDYAGAQSSDAGSVRSAVAHGVWQRNPWPVHVCWPGWSGDINRPLSPV